MIESTLVFIDGLTGAGKSTTAQRLWLHLERCGVAARWIYEHDTSHPIWPPGEVQRFVERESLPDGFLSHTLPRRWRRFAQECAASGLCTVVESALLQSTIGLLLAMNVGQAEVVECVLACEREVAALKPVLVWLRRDDVARALRAVCDERRHDDYEDSLIRLLAGTPYGRARCLSDFDGLVHFYETWSQVAEAVCAHLATRVLLVTAPDWPARERQITDRLALPPMEAPPTRIDAPARFIGCYRDTCSQDRLVIAGGERGLHLGGARPALLIPRSGASFLVTGMCLDLSFADERDGRFHRLGLHGNLPGLNPTWRRIDGGEGAPA